MRAHLCLIVSLCLLTPQAAAALIIGNNSTGALDSGDSNYLNGTRVVVGSASAVVTSMSVFVGALDAAPNNAYQLGIYADNGGIPGALVARSATGSLAPNAWNTTPVSATL